MSTNMDRYLSEIDKTPLLQAAEEHDLAVRVSAGDSAARDQMARANLRLVVRISREFTGRGLALDDLVSEGNLGLLRAVEGFNPEAGTRFSTYASFWIKQSLRVALNKGGYSVRIPQYIGTMLSKWRRTDAILRDEFGREPTREEIALKLGLTKRQVHSVMKAKKAVVAAQGGSGEIDMAETLADGRSTAPEDRLSSADEIQIAIGSIAGLGDRASTILKMRFGLEGGEAATLKVVGDRLGLTRERVRQIERDSLAAIRASMAA